MELQRCCRGELMRRIAQPQDICTSRSPLSRCINLKGLFSSFFSRFNLVVHFAQLSFCPILTKLPNRSEQLNPSCSFLIQITSVRFCDFVQTGVICIHKALWLPSFSKRTFSFRVNKANGVGRAFDTLQRLPAQWFIFSIHPSVTSFSHFTHIVKAKRTWLGPTAIYSGHFFPSWSVKQFSFFLQSLLGLFFIYLSFCCSQQLYIKEHSLQRTCRKTTDWWAQQNHSTSFKPRKFILKLLATKIKFFFLYFCKRRCCSVWQETLQPNKYYKYYFRTVWCISELHANFSDCMRISFWKAELV